MQSFIEKIGLGLVGIGTIVAGWFGYQAPEENLGASFQTPEVRALFSTTLASSISSSATSFTLTSGTDIDGTALASSTYAFIIDEGSSNEEFVLADCTSTACTNVTRGISGRTGTTSVTALKFAHRRGTSVKMTDAPSLLFAINVLKGKQNIENVLVYNSNIAVATSSNQIPGSNYLQSNYVDRWGTQTITGEKTISATTTLSGYGIVQALAPSNGSDLVNKTYADGLAIAGAPDSNETTKGIVEEATVTEINSSSATGGTGAKLFMTPAKFAVSNLASTTLTYSTTSAQNLATTTIPSALIPAKNNLSLVIIASSTGNGASTVFPRFTFNGDNTDAYNYTERTDNATYSSANGTTQVRASPSIVETQSTALFIEISNIVGSKKIGTWRAITTVDSSGNVAAVANGYFSWENTARITQIDMDFASTTALISRNAVFNIFGY